MKRAPTKRRRMIEIYFVLYIAALVMLLPSKNSSNQHLKNDILDEIFRQSFTLLPEKTVLNCRIFTDSTGSHILAFDSSNVIVCTVNVSP